MGFGPEQVDQWEPYQYAAVYRGWKSANTVAKTKAPTDEEFRAAVSRTVH